MALMDSQILDSLYGMLDQFIAFIPTLIAVIVLLIVGLILGISGYTPNFVLTQDGSHERIYIHLHTFFYCT